MNTRPGAKRGRYSPSPYLFPLAMRFSELEAVEVDGKSVTTDRIFGFRDRFRLIDGVLRSRCSIADATWASEFGGMSIEF